MHLDFIIAGFSKCGSTSLYTLLADHPEVFFVYEKDSGFLQFPDYLELWASFQEGIAKAPDGAVFGDASVMYSGSVSEQISRQRILQHFPDIKLIFIARDPCDRIESSFREFHHSGPKYGLDCPFELYQALQEIPVILQDSMYRARIDNYRQVIGDDRILVVFLEDLKTSPDRELARCFRFLGVDPDVQLSDLHRRLNRGSEKLYDDQKLREMRNGIYSPETNQALEKIPFAMQNELFAQMGLRKTFSAEPFVWDESSCSLVREKIAADVLEFMKAYDKPADFWPRFAKLIS